MTAKEFDKKVSNILSKYGVTNNKVDTPFGVMNVNVSKQPNVKFYSLHMRFIEDFDVSYFYRYFGENQNINKHTKKWNKYSENPEYILDELEERLNNLKYIFDRDGKVCGEDYKPFLEEIEN